jgi:hypothetical protein
MAEIKRAVKSIISSRNILVDMHIEHARPTPRGGGQCHINEISLSSTLVFGMK